MASGLSLLLAAGGVIAESIPKRGERVHHPRELGPGGHLSGIPTAWMSECREPEGHGLVLDGIEQRYEDSRPHTRILVGGEWQNIYPELRRKNTLQDHCDLAYELAIDLMRARARTRHIWFKGLGAEAERKRLDAEAVPGLRDFLSGFEAFRKKLTAIRDLPEYERGQVAFALRHLDAARQLLVISEGITTNVLSDEHINAMQKAQVEIEIAAEAFDAEPPPRVLSRPAYDARTGLYVIFGGDHFDYLMNDTWVFDPDKLKWFQRHPESAPPPRGKHAVTAPGDGTVRIQSGYYYPGKHRYTWIGEAVWTYDSAKNVWTGPESAEPLPPDTRAYWGGAEHPSHFLQGPKPDAAAYAEVLASLPVNTWVDVDPPYKRAGWRPLGTMAYDPQNDLIVDWNGGHSGYCSSDAPHYHLGVNRWELPYPAEIPLGMVGASAAAVSGYSFNKRHWITNHTWDHYLYDAKLERVLVAGSMSNWQWKHDPYSYIYDPVLGEWESRFRKTNGLEGVFPAGISVVHTPAGTLAYGGRGEWWILDYEEMQWERFVSLGKNWPRSGCSDWYAHIYDPTGNRILAFYLPLPRDVYRGQKIYSLDLTTKEVTLIKPENPQVLGEGFRYGREWRYLPDLRITVIGTGLVRRKDRDGQPAWEQTEDIPAYDPVKNRWLVLKVKGKPGLGFGGSMHYDKTRRLLWALDSRGNVYALRLDLEKALSGNGREG
jgi:hypothetical protein